MQRHPLNHSHLFRQLRIAFLACATALLCSCLTTPVEPAGAVPVAGTWQYRAFTDGGSPSTATGSLVLSSVNAVRYQGTLVVVETGVDGVAVRASGAVNGRLVEGQIVDFTVALPGAARTHVGSLKGDTITGRWMVSDATGMVSRSGRFDAVRR